MKQLQSVRSYLAVFVIAALVALLLPLTAAISGAHVDATAALAAQSDEVTITILHNNDGESKLLADADGAVPGISRFVAALKALQAEAGDDTITLTSGDNFLASKEFSASLENGVPFYDAVALSGLYDAMALGNHDFDFGPDVTADFVNSFDPPIPFLSANIDASNEPVLQALVDDGLIAPFTVVDVNGTDIGVIGAITPRLPNISSPRDVVISPDVAGSIANAVTELEGQGVNKIILISHLQGLSEDTELVPELAGVDIVIAGGGDELLKNDDDTCLPEEDAAEPYPLILQDSTGTDVPVVTGPGGYRCIGRLSVTFTDGDVTAFEGESIGVAIDGDQDPDVLANVEEVISAAVEDLASNALGSSEVDLDGQRSSVRTMTSNEGSLLADAILNRAAALAPEFGANIPQVALQNGGGIRNDAVIPAGDFTEADTFDIAPFANFVVVTEVPRERFLELLESAVNGFPEAEGSFPQPAGFTMTMDPNAPAREINRDGECELTGDPGSRIVDVTLDDGTKIVSNGTVMPGNPIVVATIDFLASGGDCYPLGDLDFTALGISYQQALADFVSEDLGGVISAADYPEAGTGRITAGERTEETGGEDEIAKTGANTIPVALLAITILGVGVGLVQESDYRRRIMVSTRR